MAMPTTSTSLPAKVLIANRGEIAVRVARTCREMGIATVSVYSDPDRQALHPHVCDEGIHLPGSAPSDTYLRADLLIEAARRTGADAVHPGFGFLSEDPRFAHAVLDAGLTWIGPPPDAIAAMGDKLSAKRTMEAAGVPLLPSVELPEDLDDDRDRGALLEVADEVGFPLIVKAAAGGGGKGMRVVHDRVELTDAVAAARREAASAFGDTRVFLERYVTRPRHLEVQVFGDTHGTVLHLFERECSIQRRYQKVVEESPSPAIDDDVRAALTDAAVAATQAIGYVGAGTVEFVADGSLLARRRAGETDVDPRDCFAFLEMNTRLQVEHPVTEEVLRLAHRAGRSERLDLVRWQLLVAAGLPLPATQEQLQQVGHAIEVRLYAEDPAAGYLPATGHLDVFEPDASVRWDLGVSSGDDISPFYDPMLAKAIGTAPTRPEAASRLAASLAATPVAGVTTNLDLLTAILRDEAFLAGDTTTDYLDDRGELLLTAPDTELVDRAAVCSVLHDALLRNLDAKLLPSLPIGFDPTGAFDPQVVLETGDEPVEVRYRQLRSRRWQVQVGREVDPDAWTPLVEDDEARDVEVVFHGRDRIAVEFAGRRSSARVVSTAAGERLVGVDGRWVRFRVRPRFPEEADTVSAGTSTAPMPGRITSVAVAAGEEVVAGTLLVTVEAMKMEHRITAAVDGQVSSVEVAVGDQVDAGAILAVVTDPDAGTSES